MLRRKEHDPAVALYASDPRAPVERTSEVTPRELHCMVHWLAWLYALWAGCKGDCVPVNDDQPVSCGGCAHLATGDLAIPCRACCYYAACFAPPQDDVLLPLVLFERFGVEMRLAGLALDDADEEDAP